MNALPLPCSTLSCQFAVVTAMILLAGCEQKMADQPRYEPLEASRLFADGRSARPPVPGTVPRDSEFHTASYYTGRQLANDTNAAPAGPPALDDVSQYLTTVPFALDARQMARGQERYGIHCAPCHGPAGTGNGPVVEHGYPPARSYHDDRLREAPIGYLFDVATRGIGQMPAYGERISARDRWLIVAYVRALQWSEHSEFDALSLPLREAIVSGESP